MLKADFSLVQLCPPVISKSSIIIEAEVVVFIIVFFQTYLREVNYNQILGELTLFVKGIIA